MDSLQFTYWLRGFLEIAQPKKIKKAQIDIINEHLDLVLTPISKGIKKKEYLIPQFSEVKGLKPAPPTPAELDKALATVNRWYPPKSEDVFPRLHWPDGPYASC